MAVTALTMIRRAMRLMRTLPVDREPTTAEANDGLYALNAMMQAWSIERLMVYVVTALTYSWPSSAESRTLGTGGDINQTRPTKVAEEGNFFRDTGTSIDYPLLWIGDKSSYDNILLKSTTSTYPQWIWVETNYPLMTIRVWPVPTQTLQLHLNHWKPLQEFSSLTEQIALPPGYQAAIEFNLAIWYAPEFGTAATITDDVRNQARVLKQTIRSMNTPDLIMQLDGALFGRGYPYNIYTDNGVFGRPG